MDVFVAVSRDGFTTVLKGLTEGNPQVAPTKRNSVLHALKRLPGLGAFTVR